MHLTHVPGFWAAMSSLTAPGPTTTTVWRAYVPAEIPAVTTAFLTTRTSTEYHDCGTYDTVIVKSSGWRAYARPTATVTIPLGTVTTHVCAESVEMAPMTRGVE